MDGSPAPKGNVVTPDEVSAIRGADALGVYLLFIAPFENNTVWEEEGIVGAKRFLQRFGRLTVTVATARQPILTMRRPGRWPWRERRYNVTWMGDHPSVSFELGGISDAKAARPQFATPPCPDYNGSAMKVLVTGSTGFVGANLVEGLAAAGHEVRALHRKSSRLDALAGLQYEPVIGDVLDPTSLAPAMDAVDWVFHVAAVSGYWRQDGTAWLYRVNVGGTRNVLEAALAADVSRVVFTSSAGAMASLPNGASGGRALGSAPQSKSADEDAMGCVLNESSTFDLPPTLSPYGHSKYLAEKLVHEFVARGLEIVIVNPTVILGPRDLNLISGSLILAVYRRQVPAIPPGGVNYIDVADVVAGHIAAAEQGRAGERYILGAHNLSHHRAVTIIAQVIGVPPPRLRLPGILLEPLAVGIDLFNWVWPGDPLTNGNQVRLMKYALFFDASKAKRDLGLGPPMPFPTSVERTFSWYRDNGYL